ncbi:MAG: hypothetical protein KDC24_14555 [Saprospiraceae bacterium]|nr:hypothetical protein [Saprospiraceae bacterium]
MFKYTKTTLDKLENLFKDMEFSVRYEKGSFQSGYALVESKKIVVINKFFDTDGRINTLLEILSKIEVDVAMLSERSDKFFKEFQKYYVEAETNSEV